MSREAASFEAAVTGMNIAGVGPDGRVWAQISYAEILPNPNENTIPSSPGEHAIIYVRADSLPGIKLGDKVQVALYLK